MATSEEQPKLKLYGYFRSSCAARVRLALYLKDLEFDYIPVNIKDGFHLKDDYAKINASRTVPTLYVPGKSFPITQSVAALEFIEETYLSAPPLLPTDAFARAMVRSMVNIITNDVQPITNLKIMKRVTGYGDNAMKWSRGYHADGFEAFEAILRETAGEYCFGDHITLADVCLAPAVWNAERWELDFASYPILRKVYENASKLPAFQKGHWKRQKDCPEDLRGPDHQAETGTSALS